MLKNPKKIMFLLGLLFISLTLAQGTYAKHVLFISGEDSHGSGHHQRFATCNLLIACLKNVDPEITTTLYYLPDDGWPSQAVIDSADTIFINSLGYGDSIVNNASRLSQLEAHMDSGGGLCSMSWSLAVNGSLANRWRNLIGANWYNSNHVALFYSQAFYKPATGLAHPIMNGVPDYGLNDEIFFNYNRAPASAGNLIPLLVHSATDAPYYGTGIRGNTDAKAKSAAGFEFMASWAFERAGGGRAFAHACGRYNYNFAKDSYRKNMINGIMWSLGKDIPSDGYESLTPGTDAILRHMPTASYWSSRTSSLQRMLNYNQENMMPWRQDRSVNNEVVVGTSYMARVYNNIPASITTAAPDPELNYDDPRNPANYPIVSGHEVTFVKTQLSDDYITEGAAIADMDGDGENDLIGGPAWWKGPELTQGYSYKPVIHTEFLHADGTPIDFSDAPGGALSIYTPDFFVFPVDLDGDQWTDLMTVARQGEAGEWYRNPALNPYPVNNTTDEKSHFEYQNEVNCESPIFVDVIGDSHKELISFNDNKVTITTPANSTGAWTKRTISETSSTLYRRNHGLGAGDINGDGLVDILVNHGWYEQPADLDSQAVWDFHAFAFADSAAQIQVYDVDGDGDNDVVTALRAHGYGMAWYEQFADVSAPGGIGFTQHLIMPESSITDPAQSPSGISFCQLHAMESADIDGDGVKDIVTGKCHLAHNGRDPDWEAPPVLYWFKTTRNADGSVDFVPHLIDDDSGVGRQISIGDINGDGLLDIATGNKKGVFAFIQQLNDPSSILLADAGVDYRSTAAGGTTMNFNGGKGLSDTYGTGRWNYYESNATNATDYADGSTLQPLVFASSVGNAGSSGYRDPENSSWTPVVAGGKVFTDAIALSANKLAVHPGADADEACVVTRWTAGSEEAGLVRVSGEVGRGSTNIGGGDGRDFYILKGNAAGTSFTLLTNLAFEVVDGTTAVPFDVTVSIAEGEHIDFVVNRRSNHGGDEIHFSAAISVVDLDGDGMADEWESLWVGNLTTLTQNGDYDGDGSSDVTEYLAGSNPLDAGERFEIFTVSMSVSGLQITWFTAAGKSYTIERSATLAAESWTPVASGLTESPWTDTSEEAQTVDQFFYRVKVQ